MTPSVTPLVGQIVHYVSVGAFGHDYVRRCRAAIITEVSDPIGEIVGLMIVNPSGIHLDRNVIYAAPVRAGAVEWTLSGGTWHWIEHDTF